MDSAVGKRLEGNRKVYIVADNILSPLGNTTAQNLEKVKRGVSGVKIYQRSELSNIPVAAALFDAEQVFLDDAKNYTMFEQLLIASITDALGQSDIDIKDPATCLIISSTKGNISLLETEVNSEALQKRISLNASAGLIADHFGFVNQPVIISNACISGVMAIITGMRLIQSGKYHNAIVCGADTISKFVVSGFQSFQALSNERCRPFDKNRNGLNLGEGAATIILSGNPKHKGNTRVAGGSTTNDANHISGPSRTGQELAHAITAAISEAGLSRADIDIISAHGTATIYNDDMEANAIVIAGLQNVPLFALKGFYGHTLGAAGLIESILLAKSIDEQILLPTLGFNELGTKFLNVVKMPGDRTTNTGLKTASGFGGCNTALVLSK